MKYFGYLSLVPLVSMFLPLRGGTVVSKGSLGLSGPCSGLYDYKLLVIHGKLSMHGKTLLKYYLKRFLRFILPGMNQIRTVQVTSSGSHQGNIMVQI